MMTNTKQAREHTTAEQLIERERRWWQAFQRGDGKAAAVLSDEPSTVVGAQGVHSVDRRTMASMIASFDGKLESFELRDPQVRFVTPNVAVVTYIVHEELTIDARSIRLEAADASTWIERDGEWLCTLHTESLLGDPFGRDRSKLDPRALMSSDEPVSAPAPLNAP
jgi:hypothetical protein